ncbi:hypothetical protein [Algoriphagus persicinus]|uniref:hypothetical protein n=1 Tax=Algoriphagus persicinus TaxID=3108754 RepID=UPI002B39FB66|nr:hypothetical protein [Algoriphagus sp. E1-3-M2]MEB2783145.1 hypothetical protein [Algoriphagus sp. E1-3-M2]
MNINYYGDFKKMGLKNILFWIGTGLAILFFGMLAVVSYSEWWTIKVKKHTSGYPWGSINDNPWYYDNPEIYSTVMLTEGIVFTIALAILTTQIIRAKKSRILYSLLLCFGLFILMILNGTIK